MSLGTIAAGRHRAPASGAALAVVNEQPKAAFVSALAHFRVFRPGKQITDRPQHGCKQGRDMPLNIVSALPLFAAADTPQEPVAARREPASRRGEPQCPVEPSEILITRLRPSGNGREDSKDRLAQIERLAKRRLAPIRPQCHFLLENAGAPGRQHAFGPAPIHKRRKIGKRLGRLGTAPPITRIGKGEAEILPGRWHEIARMRRSDESYHDADILTLFLVDKALGLGG